MDVIPLKLDCVAEIGSSVFDLIKNVVSRNGISVRDGDVFVVASKIVSYEQSRIVKLSDITASNAARVQAKKYAVSAELMELICREADVIYGGVEHAILTLKDGMLTVNAGIDNKNSPLGHVTLWPERLRSWVDQFRLKLVHYYSRKVGTLVTDSSCMPMRIGTVGVALAASGFKPTFDYRGSGDLYDKEIIITQHALAQSIATAAHLVMGEGSERTPIALVRGAPVEMNEETYTGLDMLIPFEKCFFAGALLDYLMKMQSNGDRANLNEFEVKTCLK
jgi:coenzyme F420-0:L-glutamate ligase/coenzyme F420-1:gamma-L-glutamate ligase